MTACPSDEQLAAYLAGALPPADAEQIRAHVERCDKCRQWLDEARANDGVLDSVRRVMAGSDSNEGLVHGAVGSAAPIGPTDGSSPPLPSYPIIPGYNFLRELNRGGQGIVYQATQKSTKRSVAIKILLEGPFASPTAAKRFQREIELAAQLKHPSIITIFDSGATAAGQPFYVMDYVEGLPLHHYVRDKKLNLEETLSLFETVCEGVQFAHQRGIIHRDLKPSNILVDREGRPKILDFGLAKWTDAPADSPLSLTHQVVGTLPYMSPEQARGKIEEIDTRTDIYALGVILYELLTGHYPYPVVGQMADVLKHIAETQPTPPSRSWTQTSGVQARTGPGLRPGRCPIDDEVQTIILKALSKERERRYQSAGEFAGDLRHYLAGEAVEARRDSGWYVFKKTFQHYRVAVSVAAVFVTFLVIAATVSTRLYFRSEAQRQAAETARLDAENAQRREYAQRLVADHARREADDRSEKLRWTLYKNGIDSVQNACEANEIARAHELLEQCQEQLRNWEWYHLKLVSDQSILTFAGHEGAVTSVVFTPDEKQIVSGSGDKSIKVWDADTGKCKRTFRGETASLPSAIFDAFFPYGPGPFGMPVQQTAPLPGLAYLLSHVGHNTVLHTMYAYYLSFSTRNGHNDEIVSLTVTPDGKKIVSASCNGFIKFWDATTGTHIRTINAGRNPEGGGTSINWIAVGPDQTRLAGWRGDDKLRIWAPETGKSLSTIEQAHEHFEAGAFSPDGLRILSSSSWHVMVWDAITGQKLLEIQRPSWERNVSVAFSPDGLRIAGVSNEKMIRIWNASTGECVLNLQGHSEPINSVAFSPDGKRIATGSDDKTVRIWDTSTGECNLTLRGHTASVRCVAFDPDGQRLASAGADQTIKLWDVATPMDTLVLQWPAPVWAQEIFVSFSPDGRRIISKANDNEMREWDVLTGKCISIVKDNTGAHSVEFSHDGKWIYNQQYGIIVNAETKESHGIGDYDERIGPFAFSPDGSQIASGGKDGDVKLWDVSTKTCVSTFRGHAASVIAVGYSPNGMRIVTSSEDKSTRIWNPLTGECVLSLSECSRSVAFSPDGKWIVADLDYALKTWDTANGERCLSVPVLCFERSFAWIGRFVVFSQDGQKLAWGNACDSVQVMDLGSSNRSTLLRGHEGRVTSLSFSPDGKRIVTGSTDKTLKIWDATTCECLLTLRGHNAAVHCVAFSPDGHRIASAGLDNTVRIWSGEPKSPMRIARSAATLPPTASAQSSFVP